MGYRSEVHIAIPKKDEAELDAILNEYDLMKGDNPAFTKEYYKLLDVEYAIYRGDFLKWNPEFKDVNAIESFIQDKPFDCCEDAGEGRMQVCVGEDSAIHSGIGDYYEVFNIYTNVELQ
jgi:hypothetical protein